MSFDSSFLVNNFYNVSAGYTLKYDCETAAKLLLMFI